MSTARDMGPDDAIDDALLDARDAEYIRRESDLTRRAAVRCVVTTYRRPDHLAVGDIAPGLALPRLDGAGTETIGPGRGRPLAIFFGSYT